MPDLTGKLGVIEDANPPHYGEVVVVVKVDGDILTVEPHEPTDFTFAQAELPRSHVRML